MNRKTPVEFINVIINWYSRCTYCVRVGMVLSPKCRSVCGVYVKVGCRHPYCLLCTLVT